MPDGIDEWLTSEEELFLSYPHLLTLQEEYERASALYHLGDLESTLFVCNDLLATIGEMQLTHLEPAVCDFLERLEDETTDLLQHISNEEIDRYSREQIAAALDSIARNHVVEESIEIVYNWRTEHWVKYFTGRGRSHFIRWLERVEIYRDIIEPILVETGLPRDFLYLAVIESGLNLNARSWVKAVGPWQFMTGTGRLFGLRINWWIDERKDIIASTYAAAHYLRYLHNLFGSWPLALAAYNAGEYRVAHAISRQKTDDYWKLNLPSQTKWFVPKFMAALEIGRDPLRYGFGKSVADPLNFDIVSIDKSTDLSLIAKACGCTVTTLKNLNPALKRWATPPDMVLELKIPAGTRERCVAALLEIPPEERISWHRHTIRTGETLSQIADRYEISIGELKRMNKISNAHRIRAGTTLMIPVRNAAHVAQTPSEPSYRTPPDLPDKITLKRYDAPSGHEKIVYTVKDRDTLSEIAERFHVGLSRLRSWNDLRYSSVIHPGDRLVLYLPPDSPYASVADDESGGGERDGKRRIVHVVRKGETLSQISSYYRTRIADILAWNEGLHKDRLHPGDRITIWLD